LFKPRLLKLGLPHHSIVSKSSFRNYGVGSFSCAILRNFPADVDLLYPPKKKNSLIDVMAPVEERSVFMENRERVDQKGKGNKKAFNPYGVKGL
jgi:hypothetical protein